MKKKSLAKKIIPYLDYMCQIGEIVQWSDVTGKKYTGKLVAMDADYLATVKLEDGTLVEYQC